MEASIPAWIRRRASRGHSTRIIRPPEIVMERLRPTPGVLIGRIAGVRERIARVLTTVGGK
jgi:hypothetical protein